MKRSWSRREIVRCQCSDLSYAHVHCPCIYCNGKPVSSSVEYRHWHWQNSLELAEPVLNLARSSAEADFDNEDNGNSTSVHQDWLQDSSGGDCESLSPDQQPELEENSGELRLKNEIVCAICRALMLVNQMQGTLNDFEEVLVFAKDLFCHSNQSLTAYWPKNWRETEKLLKECGYKEPKEFTICLDQSHPCHWDVIDSPSATCRHCGKSGNIKYYYLGLSQKIKTWFSDPSMCEKMLAHWINREAWISGIGPNFELCEVWDGSRFNELSWFWNPDKEWVLPYRCHCCGNVITVEQIEAFPERDGVYTIQCEECGERTDHQPKSARGEPRNIALIGHWDGWQPFGSPGQHSCGALEVTIANMYKKDRNATDEVYVVGFVPSHMLPKKRPNALDPFLEPLISEIENIFIDGYEVEYVGDFPHLPAGNIVVRVLLLLWTGDYPAQCEVGKFIKGGILACRRDKVKGTINPMGGTHYYYGQNRLHARFPWEERKLAAELAKMKEVADEDRPTVRERLSRESGYTGLSILHRLHKLYGFDVIKDTVFDVMHNLPLNIVGNLLKDMIAEEKLDAKVADERLAKFPWTAELKDGRIPHGLSSRLGYWKTEEFQKFSYPASEVLLAGLLEPLDYHLWQLTVRMTELIFNHRNMWSHDDLQLFEHLAKRFIILTEEQRGLTACRITVHNLQHISEDAYRFSHPDNYWCYPYERAVRRYVGISSNFKNIECSFAKRESFRELLKVVRATILPQEEPSFKVDLQKMCAKSLKAAKHIKKLIATNPESASSFKEGVLVGGMLSSEVHLSQEDIDLIMSDSSLPSVFPDMAFSFKNLWKPDQTPQGMLYRKGEHVVLLDNANEQHVCQVEYFLCLEVDGEFSKTVKVLKYSMELDEEGNPLSDPYSGGLITDITTGVQVLIAPVTAILRKAILYNYNDPLHPGRRTVLDFQREIMPITWGDIQVPFHPQIDDMIFIKGDNPHPWLAKVLTIQERAKTAKVVYYVEDVQRPGGTLYVQCQERRQAQDIVSWDSILCHANGEWRGDTWIM